MSFLIFLQNLPLHTLLAVTVLIGLVLCWASLALVRVGVRLFGTNRAKEVPIHDLVTVTSILFALMLSFSAAGIWNDWVQSSGAVQREALALEKRAGACGRPVLRPRGEGQGTRQRLRQGGGGI